MAQLGIGGLWRRPAAAAATADSDPAERLERLLPEGVSAILLPHLKKALSSYGARDHLVVLAAYGVGCMVLADLLAQNKALNGWREAGERALGLLARRCEVEDLYAPEHALTALRLADDLIQEHQGGPEYLAACHMLDSAIADLADRKTQSRGAVALRAAMARLEAIALRTRTRTTLAA